MAAQTPTTSTSTPSLSIALPPQSSSLTTSIAQQVQSPGTQLNRTDFPQMIRLPNGELAQVTVTPLGSGGGTPGSAGVGGGVPQNQFPAQQQQQPVLLKPIPTKQPPPAQSQPQQQPQTQQQQVVVNMAGQQFLLTQGGGGGGVPQQAANPPPAAGRGQALPQQPGQVQRPQTQQQQVVVNMA